MRGVTTGAHNAAKTRCKWGHPFDETNTEWKPNGARNCKACHTRREWQRRYQRRLSSLLTGFIQADADARIWLDWNRAHHEPDDLGYCRTMTERFTAFAIERGYPARKVYCEPPEPEPWYDDHWFTVIGDCAIDWTAKQFYNVADKDDDWLRPADIPAPMLFRWPGRYPLPHMTLVEKATEIVSAGNDDD